MTLPAFRGVLQSWRRLTLLTANKDSGLGIQGWGSGFECSAQVQGRMQLPPSWHMSLSFSSASRHLLELW